MTEHEHVWIGYCDLCNGQHCVTLKAADAKVERKLHGDPVCVAALRERDAPLLAMLKRLQWLPDSVGYLRCPECFGHALHEPGCALRALLKEEP